MTRIGIFVLLFSFLFIQISLTQSQENVNDFDLIDLNKDGFILINELEKWYNFKFNQSNGNAYQLFVKYDLNQDEKLTVAEFVPLAFALSRKPLKEKEQFFNRLDVNGDHILTHAEILRSDAKISEEIINGLFQVADINHDGQITYQEYELVTGNANPFRNYQNGLEQSLVSSVDQNNDNRLTEAEINNFSDGLNFNQVSKHEISKMFQQLDKNNDKFLTAVELKDLPNHMIKLFGIVPMPAI